MLTLAADAVGLRRCISCGVSSVRWDRECGEGGIAACPKGEGDGSQANNCLAREDVADAIVYIVLSVCVSVVCVSCRANDGRIVYLGE